MDKVVYFHSLVFSIVKTGEKWYTTYNDISKYNYTPKIQERVEFLDEYKDKIPTQENKIVAKIFASILFLALIIGGLAGVIIQFVL